MLNSINWNVVFFTALGCHVGKCFSKENWKKLSKEKRTMMIVVTVVLSVVVTII